MSLFPISKRLTFFGLFSYMQFSRYMFAPLVRSSRLMPYQLNRLEPLTYVIRTL